MPRYSASRQKACQACSTAKARCDRKTDICSRCAERNLRCNFPTTHKPSPSRSAVDKTKVSPFLLTPPESQLPAIEHPVNRSNVQSIGKSSTYGRGSDSSIVSTHHFETPQSFFNAEAELDNKCLRSSELVCPIDANAISCRWLNSYVPLPGQQVKNYPVKVTSFIFRLLRSYTAISIRGNSVPPFIHPSQVVHTLIDTPLTTCFSFIRMWQAPHPTATSAAADVLVQEMQKLYNNYPSFDFTNVLAAFQAYLIYTMVLFFYGGSKTLFLRQAMTNLQEIASNSSRQGLLCSADSQSQRPSWTAWIHAETKRRTLYATYLFDSLLSAEEGLNTYLGTELRGLPAPSTQTLWQVQSQQEFIKKHAMYLADWTDKYLTIDELWPASPELDTSGIAERRSRVDRWLETVDTFGMMLYTVTSQTHGV